MKQPVNSEPGDKQKILLQWKLSHNTHTANSTRVCPLTGVLKLTHKDLHTFTHDASKINDPKIRNKYFLFEMRQTHAGGAVDQTSVWGGPGNPTICEQPALPPEPHPLQLHT